MIYREIENYGAPQVFRVHRKQSLTIVVFIRVSGTFSARTDFRLHKPHSGRISDFAKYRRTANFQAQKFHMQQVGLNFKLPPVFRVHRKQSLTIVVFLARNVLFSPHTDISIEDPYRGLIYQVARDGCLF